MQSTRIFTMCLYKSRCISSTSINSNLSRESKFMKKIMQGTHKSKRKWYDTSADLRDVTKTSPTNKPLSVHTVRRMTVRNKIFMEYVTDLMSTGAVSDIIKDIEITHVKITPDFKYVNVFWACSNDAALPINEEALQKCARIIRHELSQLRVIGVVPPIQFVENKQVLLEKEVERRLALVESDLESLQDSDENTFHQTSDEKLLTNRNPETDGSNMELPIMRNDVLGLDHHKIMSQIILSLSKSKVASQRRMLDVDVNTDNRQSKLTTKEVTDFLTQEEQQKIFADFLTKRRIEENRKYRMDSHKYKHKLLDDFKEEMGFDEDEEDDDIAVKYSDKYEDKE